MDKVQFVDTEKLQSIRIVQRHDREVTPIANRLTTRRKMMNSGQQTDNKKRIEENRTYKHILFTLNNVFFNFSSLQAYKHYSF